MFQLKIPFILIIISLTILSFINFKTPNTSYNQDNTERYYQLKIQEQIGGVTEYVLDDGSRVDLLLPNKAIEIDWDHKWAEGIGQSLYYGIKTSRPPVVLLLTDNQTNNKYSNKVRQCGVECWLFNIRTMELIK